MDVNSAEERIVLEEGREEGVRRERESVKPSDGKLELTRKI